MSYAVFRDGDRIAGPFKPKLVENRPTGRGSVQVLDGHCTIKSCDSEFVMPANLA